MVKNNYIQEEYDYIKNNIISYRRNGSLNFESFIYDFNSKFESKINKYILKNIMRKLNVKVGKPDYIKVIAKYDKSQHEIGSEVKFPSNYIYIKTNNVVDNSIQKHRLYKMNWTPKHVYIYEEYHNVKVKENEMVVFIDKNKNNYSIDNLLLTNRKEQGKMIYFQHIKDVEIRKTAYILCKTECMIEDVVSQPNKGDKK